MASTKNSKKGNNKPVGGEASSRTVKCQYICVSEGWGVMPEEARNEFDREVWLETARWLGRCVGIDRSYSPKGILRTILTEECAPAELALSLWQAKEFVRAVDEKYPGRIQLLLRIPEADEAWPGSSELYDIAGRSFPCGTSGLSVSESFLTTWASCGNQLIKLDEEPDGIVFRKKAVAPGILISKNSDQHFWIELGREQQVGQVEKEGEFDRVFAEAKHVLSAAKESIIGWLTPALNVQLGRMPHVSYKEKQEAASWANHHLRELGLAIRCPKTGRPAILVADERGGEYNVSRFRLQIRDEHGHAKRTWSSQDVPTLQLMEDDPREEPIAGWAVRARRQSKEKRRH